MTDYTDVSYWDLSPGGDANGKTHCGNWTGTYWQPTGGCSEIDRDLMLRASGGSLENDVGSNNQTATITISAARVCDPIAIAFESTTGESKYPVFAFQEGIVSYHFNLPFTQSIQYFYVWSDFLGYDIAPSAYNIMGIEFEPSSYSSSSTSSSSESSSSSSLSSSSSSESSSSSSQSSSSFSLSSVSTAAYSGTEHIRADSQKLNVGSGLVELYVIDTTDLFSDGTKYYITPATSGSTSIVFNGITYSPVPVKFDGVQMTSTGQLSRPTITVGNVTKAFTSIVRTYNQLLGATVTRRRTFEKYLDFGTDPTPSAMFPQDVYVVERMVSMDKTAISWELKSEIDLENRYLPKRQVLDLCDHIYRSWDTTELEFDYTNATCPYTAEVSGSSYFDGEDTPCAAADDECSKKLNACQLRFGTNAQLPYRGFPGVGKIGYPYR